VPYAEFADPQTLNLYSYVRNLPTTKADIDGHGWPDLLLRALGAAGDAALAADNAPKVVSSKSTASDRIEGGLNLASIFFAPLAVEKTNTAAFDHLGEKLGITQEPTKHLEVSTANDLKSRSEPGDGLDIHHAPQAHAAEQVIPGYDRKTGPAVAVTEAEHAVLNGQNIKGATDLSPRDLMAKTARDLRKAEVPNSTIREVIDLAKKLFTVLER
jgi:hypothetical protein